MTAREESLSLTIVNTHGIDRASELVSCPSEYSASSHDTEVYHGSESGSPTLAIGSQCSSAINTLNMESSLPLTEENLSRFNQAIEDEHKENEKCATLIDQQTTSLVENLMNLGVDIPDVYIKRMRPAAIKVTPMRKFLADMESTNKQVKMYERYVREDLGHVSHVNEIPLDEEDHLSLSPKGPISVEEASLMLYLQKNTISRDTHTGYLTSEIGTQYSPTPAVCSVTSGRSTGNMAAPQPDTCARTPTAIGAAAPASPGKRTSPSTRADM